MFALGRGSAEWIIEGPRVAYENSETDLMKDGVEVQYVSGARFKDPSNRALGLDSDLHFNASLKAASESLVEQLKSATN